MRDKPDWFFDKNPYGTVPTIERDDDVIYESAACDYFLEEEFGGKSLTPSNKKDRYRQKMFMDAFSTVISKFYTLVRSENKSEAVDVLVKSIQPFEQEIANKKFYGESEVSMLDLHMWPFMERLKIGEDMFNLEILKRLPNISQWMDNMQTVECVQKTDMGEGLRKFMKTYSDGEYPDYDYKIEEDNILEA